MAFGWENYLGLAQRLASTEDEASRRTAISRAYYFVFHLARQRALDNGCRIYPGEATHKQVWRFYTSSPDFACKRIGLQGERLQARRNSADYDLPFRGRLSEDVSDVLQVAAQMPELLSRLDPRQPRAS